MSQDEILEIIKDHPGSTQKEIRDYTGLSQPTVVEQCRKLRIKKLIRGEWIPKKQSYKLYAEE